MHRLWMGKSDPYYKKSNGSYIFNQILKKKEQFDYYDSLIKLQFVLKISFAFAIGLLSVNVKVTSFLRRTIQDFNIKNKIHLYLHEW